MRRRGSAHLRNESFRGGLAAARGDCCLPLGVASAVRARMTPARHLFCCAPRSARRSPRRCEHGVPAMEPLPRVTFARHTSDILNEIAANAPGARVSLGEIVASLGDRGFALLMV